MRILALLLTLLIGPGAAMAGHARCLAAPHHCAPAPAPLTCCCITVADGDQQVLAGVIVVNPSAARGEAVGNLAAMPLRIVFAHPSAPVPSPPIDRLALCSQLLI